MPEAPPSTTPWRLLTVIGLVAAVLLLVGAAVVDARTQARVRHDADALAGTRHQLAAAQLDRDATAYVAAAATDHRDALARAIAASNDQVGQTEASLAVSNVGAFLAGLDEGTLHTCLGGVDGSLRSVSANDLPGAIQHLSSVAAPCSALTGGSAAGLVYPFDFPDPDVLDVSGTAYAYATNAATGAVQVLTSNDLVHWTVAGNALPRLPGWAVPGATWAPGIVQLGSSYRLYYTAKVAGPGGGEECISVATASQPLGPFTDMSSHALECQASLGGSIDPSPFIDASGALSLQWRSIGAQGQPATIWSEQLNADGNGFAPGTAPVALIVADQQWEAGVVEAPDLVLHGGRYFLFFSGNNWNSASYAVGVATCAGPLGPCTSSPSGPILTSGPGVAGPGSASIFTDSTGTAWIAFDGFSPGAVGYPNGRSLYLRRLDLSRPVPAVASP